MTPLSRDLHPSNGRRAPKDEVVVSITSAAHHRDRVQPQPPQDLDHDDLSEPHPSSTHLELLRLLSEGADDEMVARRLEIDMAELRMLVLSLASELGACNRFQLALRAREAGWV